METFDYAALDPDGKRLTGSVSATSAREARDILRAQRLTPIDLTAAKTANETSSRFTFELKASHKDLTQATRQLAILIDAATPIETALKVTALQFEKSPMRQILLDTRSRVLEGERLSDALKAHPKTFDELFTAMVASGETSGKLGAVLERLASDLETSQKIRRTILAATIYPAILTLVALAVTVLLMVFVVPLVVEQFDSFGQDLPLLTRIVIALSEWTQKWGLLALGLVVLAGFIWSQALKNEAIKRRWHQFLLGVPVVGNITRNLNAARFSRTMAGLIEAGTPSLTAMETAQHTVKNRIMRSGVIDAATMVREGSPMSTALKRTDVFPPLVTQMVAGGETGGKVGLMFGKSADYLESEFEAATAVFLNLLEPLIIVLMGLVVLLIVAAIFMPMFQLNSMVY